MSSKKAQLDMNLEDFIQLEPPVEVDNGYSFMPISDGFRIKIGDVKSENVSEEVREGTTVCDCAICRM